MQTTAIIVAAGAGVRMGARHPKAFLDLAGCPLVEHSLRAFQQHDAVDAIVLMFPVGFEQPSRELAARYPKVAAVAPGGRRRQDTVAMALPQVRALAGGGPAGGGEAVVLVHDAARALVPAALITAVMAAVIRTGAAIPGLRPADTVRETNAPGGDAAGPVLAGATRDRDRLVLVQTPQAFRLDLLERAHAAGGREDVTDDAALVLRLGHPVEVVAGSERNFKITTPWDMRLAAAMLAD